MDKKLNGRTYFVETSDDVKQGEFMATYYGLRAYGSTIEQATRRCDLMVQEQTEPEDC